MGWVYWRNSADREQVREGPGIAAEALVHRGDTTPRPNGTRLAEGKPDVAHGPSDVFAEALPPGSPDFRYIIPRVGAVAWVGNDRRPQHRPAPRTAPTSSSTPPSSRESTPRFAKCAGVATPNAASIEHVLPEPASNRDICSFPEVRGRIRILGLLGEVEAAVRGGVHPSQPVADRDPPTSGILLCFPGGKYGSRALPCPEEACLQPGGRT